VNQASASPAPRSDRRVWMLTASLASIAIALLTVQLPDDPTLGIPGWGWWALLPVFAVAEAFAIHLPTLRNAHSHTLREIPAVMGLAFLSPVLYVSAYVIGSGVALVLGRSQRGVKLAFNLCMFALEASLRMLIYRIVLGGADPVDPRGWAAALVAILVTDLVSIGAVTAAISLTENRFDGDIFRDALRYSLPAGMVNTCMALLCVVLVVRAPTAMPLLALPLVLLVVAYRGYMAFGRGYSQLRLLYRFVGSTSRSVELDEAVEALLGEARELLGADRAELVILPVQGESGSRAVLEGSGPPTRTSFVGPDPSRDAWWAPAALGEPVLRAHRGGTDRGRSTLPVGSEGPPRDGLAAPLRTDGRVEGVLLVANRTFQRETFGSEDLRLFETLAGHAAVTLGKARLVARLRRLALRRQHEARHDALTGLPNWRAFQEDVEVLAGSSGAVLLIDLDDFKDVNDTLGHNAGDLLLRKTGERLAVATGAMVARLGGDEFGVLLTGVTAEQAREQAQRVLTAISQPVSLDGVNLFVTASVGIALVPEHGTEPNQLLQHADMAMYVAKAARSEVEIYSPDDALASHRRLVLAGDLAAAVEEHAFEVWYQPQADASTGRVVGAEALLRWRHPTYGAVTAPEIVTLAERTGQLRRLTDGVLEDALRQRAAWSQLGHQVSISVNITPADLYDIEFPAVVGRLLEETGTPAGNLTLEITESGVMSDPARSLVVLDVLAAMGVRLSVDDFGIGHSSLAYLERLPVHEVKIDQSFIKRLEREATDSKVVRATVALAHDLGLVVVAEGVESRAAWRRVEKLGAELIQGYTLARPMPGIETIDWLDKMAALGGVALPTQYKTDLSELPTTAGPGLGS